jgi:hypothetical protein
MATPQPARIVGADPIGRSAPKCCFVRVLIRVSQPVIWALKLPAIAPAEHQEEISKLEETIARRSAKVDRLTALAGDRALEKYDREREIRRFQPELPERQSSSRCNKTASSAADLR